MNGPFETKGTGQRYRTVLTQRQEAFAHHVARGETLANSYRLAGYNANPERIYANASVLAKMTKVAKRITAIRSDMDALRLKAEGATMIVTAQSVSLMLAEAFEDAKRWKQSGAQVSAAMGLAKVHGLLVDKTEDVTRRATRDPDAPLEIDVDHWVNEQVPLLLDAARPRPEALSNGADASPEPLQSGAEMDAPRVCDDTSPDLHEGTSPQGPSPEGAHARGPSPEGSGTKGSENDE